jgi:ADP-ribose pyrophosphatase YjhB (NUDIX family)
MKTKSIRPISLCLFRNGNRILVSTHCDAVKQDSFCRPLGGGIEFGESSREAMIREVREEIGLDIENLQLLSVLENVFSLEGQPRHEIVFIYDAEFKDKSLYEMQGIDCYEDSIDAKFQAKWLSLEEIKADNIRLVPEELEDLLTK